MSQCCNQVMTRVTYQQGTSDSSRIPSLIPIEICTVTGLTDSTRTLRWDQMTRLDPKVNCLITALRWAMPRSHLNVKARPVRATKDHFREIEWDMAMSWQLWVVHDSFRVYVAVTGSTPCSFTHKSPCMALPGHIYVKVWPWYKQVY